MTNLQRIFLIHAPGMPQRTEISAQQCLIADTGYASAGVGWNNTNTLAESPKHAKHKPGHRELLTPMYALCSTSHFRLSKLVC